MALAVWLHAELVPFPKISRVLLLPFCRMMLHTTCTKERGVGPPEKQQGLVGAHEGSSPALARGRQKPSPAPSILTAKGGSDLGNNDAPVVCGCPRGESGSERGIDPEEGSLRPVGQTRSLRT